MNRSGRTPLLRAKNLEKILGISEIYLKLEGANPYGHKFDRIGELLVKDARMSKRTTILIDGPRRYIDTVCSYADQDGFKIIIPVFKGQSWKSKTYSKDQLITMKGSSLEDQQLSTQLLCEKENYYNGANGYYNTHLAITALEEIGEEICERLDEISSVYVQLSYGYTVSSLYNSFFKAWAKGSMDRYPNIISCTIPKGNRVFDDYVEQNKIADIEDYDLKINKYTKDLYIENTQLLEETLKAVKDTEGEIITVTEDLLKEASALLRSTEQINLSTEEAYSFAGFYKMAKTGLMKKGTHIIILNDGRSDVQIERVTDNSQFSIEVLKSYVDNFLMQYSDPLDEIEESIENALAKGAIFLAFMNKEVQGITIVVHGGFEKFFPTYHLAYIGTNKGRKGRGIASALIDEVIQFSDGKVSLHVDLDNKRAKKLYEKFGFKHKYNRMIYSQ
ncbi:MAG: pyridoxal-phosphate dependent enzyme [Spirochaetaceae bacterium]|jgi:threonine synthase|nr:pyridoxal-phosphate dependent enzyme [Spirochaetaceae bacterium]